MKPRCILLAIKTAVVCSCTHLHCIKSLHNFVMEPTVFLQIMIMIIIIITRQGGYEPFYFFSWPVFILGRFLVLDLTDNRETWRQSGRFQRVFVMRGCLSHLYPPKNLHQSASLGGKSAVFFTTCFMLKYKKKLQGAPKRKLAVFFKNDLINLMLFLSFRKKVFIMLTWFCRSSWKWSNKGQIV